MSLADVAERAAEANATASPIASYVKRQGSGKRTITTVKAFVPEPGSFFDLLLAKAKADRPEPEILSRETHRVSNANGGTAGVNLAPAEAIKAAKTDWIVGEYFKDAWDGVWCVTRTEPGYVWARQGWRGSEKRFLRSKIFQCVKHDKTIGRPQRSHGRPTPDTTPELGAHGSTGGTMFKNDVRQEGIPRYTETAAADGTVKNVRIAGDWPHNTSSEDAPVQRPNVPDRDVRVTTVGGKLIVTISEPGEKLPVTTTPAVKAASSAKLTGPRVPAQDTSVKVKVAPTMTARQARGSYDPSIGSEPMNAVNHVALQCPKKVG